MKLKELRPRPDDDPSPRIRAARAVFYSVLAAPAAWSGVAEWTPQSDPVAVLLLVSGFASLIALGYWAGLGVDAIVYWETRRYRDNTRE